ncbi:TolB family protein [Nonomuraea sp. NPDC052265]|uniref:TolB family protein n=1 Tax=Nonomuraea sp. NPDC052265 TaxID=3364374 RepID=UPI0037CA5607
MRRVLVLVAAVVLLAGGATAYATWAASSRQAAPAVAGFDAAEPGRVLVRSGGRVASVPLADPGAPPRVSSRACDRFYTANGTTLCLVTRPGPLPKTEALVLDRSLKETRRINLAGVPSRARVSASGRMASWTVFVTGDSYSTGGFSTWTGILDTRTGYLITNMEDIPLYLDGRRYHSADVNYWGVTFAADDNRFYATVSTKGRTYLVEGDFGAWRARALRENAECPSLSPDGTRLVFKKRVSPGPWRLHLLDLATMRESPLGERASIDDQAAWLDDRTVMYAKDGDVWAADVGGGPPHRLVPGGTSPAAVR